MSKEGNYHLYLVDFVVVEEGRRNLILSFGVLPVPFSSFSQLPLLCLPQANLGR
jgi:hypothetical protein